MVALSPDAMGGLHHRFVAASDRVVGKAERLADKGGDAEIVIELEPVCVSPAAIA